MSKNTKTPDPAADDNQTGGGASAKTGDSAAADNNTAKADNGNNAADKSTAAGNADNGDNANNGNNGKADNGDNSNNADNADDALAAAQKDAAEKHDMFMRKAAELENFRRRAALDMENAINLAMEQIALAICDVRDSIHAAANDDNQTADNLREGIRVILQKTDSVLQVNNIKPVHPDCGVIFDPELHMAVATEENDDLPPNAIVRILQTGYTINARLLRPASVIVSKPREDNPAADDNNTGGSGE